MTSSISFLDLAGDFAEVADDARARVEGVLSRQGFVLGPETAELEASMRSRIGSPCALACSSGSDALYLAMLALDIGPGDAVLCPSFTFFATAGAVARAGARPVFVDADGQTLISGADEMRAAVEREFAREPGGEWRRRETGERLAAMVPVHLYGRAAPMRDLSTLAEELGLRIIEDAAQAIDARGDAGMVGTWGDVACFSFYPTKNLGGAGDGGLLTTGNAELGERLARLRVHGAGGGSYYHEEVGINARMGELQAAVLNAKLPRLDDWNAARARHAARYRELLRGVAQDGLLQLPPPSIDAGTVWHQFTVRIGPGGGISAAPGERTSNVVASAGKSLRDGVAHQLDEAGIPARVFYPLPLHLQPCFSSLGYSAGDLPVCEAAAGDVLCLPVHSRLTEDDVLRVASELERVVRELVVQEVVA